jgi:hypothetical protein
LLLKYDTIAKTETMRAVEQTGRSQVCPRFEVEGWAGIVMEVSVLRHLSRAILGLNTVANDIQENPIRSAKPNAGIERGQKNI